MKHVTMFNPNNRVVIKTTPVYQHRWEQLGFVVANNVIVLNRRSK